MSLRKIAGLLVAGGIAVALIGGGVGASFFDNVSATQNIHVATLACTIIAPTEGTIAGDGKSVTYTAPEITSSVASTAPFHIYVSNTGGVNITASITAGAVSGPPEFTTLPLGVPQAVTVGSWVMFDAGLQWSVLQNSDMNQWASITYTVHCGDGPAVTFFSTNRGTYGGQDSVRFAGGGSGFTPGDTIDVAYSWAAGGPWDLATYWGAVGESAPVADAGGNFTYWFADNCHNGHQWITDEVATVTAMDTHGHTATGTGILACHLMAP